MAERVYNVNGQRGDMMHIATGITPNADARKCRAKFVLTYGKDGSTQTFESSSILSVNIISEYSEGGENEPICELNVVLDNSDSAFNVTDKNNLYYSLSMGTTYGKILISTVSHGASDVFLSKSKLQYDSISFSKSRVTLKFFDPFGFDLFDQDGMTRACNKTDGTARAIVDYIMEDNSFAARCEISDALNNVRTFSQSNFQKNGEYMTQRVGLRRIAALFSTTSNRSVICYIDDNGNLKYDYQKIVSDKTETLTETDYIDFRIEPPETMTGAAIGVFNDRGNILREIGDVVSLSQGTEVLNMRIFRIAYSYNNGVLSAENKGYILT